MGCATPRPSLDSNSRISPGIGLKPSSQLPQRLTKHFTRILTETPREPSPHRQLTSARMRGTRPFSARWDLRHMVHPRRCRERGDAEPIGFQTTGSSPRVRKRLGEESLRQAQIGSSPRVRRTRRADPIHLSRARFIPAGAGNAATAATCLLSMAVHPRGCGDALRARRSECGAPVHPRGCGERAMRRVPVASLVGSSPRMRGTLTAGLHQHLLERFIPTDAGNAAGSTLCSMTTPVHPRECGERVNRTRPKGDGRRFIPADAGNAPVGTGPLPRYGGSSPRVRGTPPGLRLNW